MALFVLRSSMNKGLVVWFSFGPLIPARSVRRIRSAYSLAARYLVRPAYSRAVRYLVRRQVTWQVTGHVTLHVAVTVTVTVTDYVSRIRARSHVTD
jgi:hypothetical protein